MLRGAFVGGGVGLGLALVRGGRVAEDERAWVVRTLKSVAEGAVAGSVAGLLATLARRRAGAARS